MPMRQSRESACRACDETLPVTGRPGRAWGRQLPGERQETGAPGAPTRPTDIGSLARADRPHGQHEWLLVRNHDNRFNALMDRYLPSWRQVRRTLNEAPLAHTRWAY